MPHDITANRESRLAPSVVTARPTGKIFVALTLVGTATAVTAALLALKPYPPASPELPMQRSSGLLPLPASPLSINEAPDALHGG